MIELYDDVKVGAQRFLELVKGVDGVGYRLSKFDEIADDKAYIVCSGIRSLTYSAGEPQE